MTNNAVEGFNRVLKDHWIDRTKDNMEIFLPKMEQMMVHWSKRSAELGFAVEPEISNKQWDEAVGLVRSGLLQIMNVGHIRAVRNARSGSPMVSPREYGLRYFRPEAEIQSFSDYACFLGSWNVISSVGTGYYTCSCEEGLKSYRCKHSVAMEINDGVREIPARFNVQPLPISRRRGRPPKVSGGLGGGKKPKN